MCMQFTSYRVGRTRDASDFSRSVHPTLMNNSCFLDVEDTDLKRNTSLQIEMVTCLNIAKPLASFPRSGTMEGPAATPRDREAPVDYARPIKVICIGAGMSGILCGIRFPQRISNLDLTIYDKNDEVGGVWYENKYVTPIHVKLYIERALTDLDKIPWRHLR